MLDIIFSFADSDSQRRKLVFEGAILFCPATDESRSLCNSAREYVREAFGELDPEHAQESMQVERFVEIVGPLKSRFTNASATKESVRAFLVSLGVDPETTYFDVPRLRVVPHSSYLTAGVSYAYRAHRDTWYSSPPSQINWWLPVWQVTPARAMTFYPSYWERPVPNTSEDFDYDEWKRVARGAAQSQIKQDARKHPLPMQEFAREEEFRYGAAVGDFLVFSAAHLHATVPNTSGATRYSIDFRTINIEDLRRSEGAPNVDSRARGSTLGDFLRVKDFHPIEHCDAAEVA